LYFAIHWFREIPNYSGYETFSIVLEVFNDGHGSKWLGENHHGEGVVRHMKISIPCNWKRRQIE
jgi:hypothetical protein